MASKPRMMVRLAPEVVALLEWYAAARAVAPAEMAAELIVAGVAEAVGDADLRATIQLQAGPPPDVPLAVLAPRRLTAWQGVGAALSELRAVGEEFDEVAPRLAGRVRLAVQRVEAHLVLLRDAVNVRHVQGRIPPAKAPVATTVIDDRGAAIAEG